jgi:hypothetical protein
VLGIPELERINQMEAISMKSITKRFLTAVVVTFLWTMVSAPVSPAQSAEDQSKDDKCTVASLHGSYGYYLSGPLIGLGPVAAVGIATLNGAGGLSAVDTVSNNGVIGRRNGSGVYTMNSNCTGSVSLNGDFMGFSADFTVVPESRGREFTFIVTNSFTNQAGEAKRVARQDGDGDEGCTLADLQGTYRVWGAGTNLAKGLTTAVGYRILDGQGSLTLAEDTISVAGQIGHRIGRTAVYTVASNCAVTEAFADGLTFDGVVVAGGREAFFIRTNPGFVITALYKKYSESDGSEEEAR